MPKLPVIPAKELLRLVLKYGCILHSIRGSHFNVYNPNNNKRSTIPIHGKRDLSKAFFANILNQLDIDVDDFLEFMKNN